MKKIGLVLSGGGAKGAYQVGVMKALLEMNVGIDAIAGASIGALNGGVLASAPDLAEGTKRLERLWDRLPEIKPLQPRQVKLDLSALAGLWPYLTLLASAGLRSHPAFLAVSSLLSLGKETGRLSVDKLPESIKSLAGGEYKSLLDDRPLQEMMAEFLDIEQLQNGIPLYVSVFQNENTLLEVVRMGVAEFLGIDNKPAIFKHIQTLPQEQQKEMLLASAAIPILFESRKDEDGKTTLNDGGMGGWIKMQGNTPITPLVEAGCDFVIVSHLSHGSLWHRHDFPDTTCIELRPKSDLSLGFLDIFDFSKEKIDMLKRAGYEDTMRELGRIKETLSVLYAKRAATQALQAGREKQKQLDDELAAAMKRLE